MVEDRIGQRYAKALYAEAESRGEIEAVHEDMERALVAIRDNKELDLFLASPLIPSHKKHKVLEHILISNAKSQLSAQLILLMIDKGREGYIQYAAKAFLHHYDQEKGILRGSLESAHALSDELKTEIKSVVETETGKTFEMESSENPELLGGFVLKIGDRTFDGSVVSRLNRIRREFTQA